MIMKFFPTEYLYWYGSHHESRPIEVNSTLLLIRYCKFLGK